MQKNMGAFCTLHMFFLATYSFLDLTQNFRLVLNLMDTCFNPRPSLTVALLASYMEQVFLLVGCLY